MAGATWHCGAAPSVPLQAQQKRPHFHTNQSRTPPSAQKSWLSYAFLILVRLKSSGSLRSLLPSFLPTSLPCFLYCFLHRHYRNNVCVSWYCCFLMPIRGSNSLLIVVAWRSLGFTTGTGMPSRYRFKAAPVNTSTAAPLTYFVMTKSGQYLNSKVKPATSNRWRFCYPIFGAHSPIHRVTSSWYPIWLVRLLAFKRSHWWTNHHRIPRTC